MATNPPARVRNGADNTRGSCLSSPDWRPKIRTNLPCNARPYFWSVRFDCGTCVFLPHGGSEADFRQVADLPGHQSIRGWEWRPRKFGELNTLLHQKKAL